MQTYFILLFCFINIYSFFKFITIGHVRNPHIKFTEF
jgi:hypothetical protein